MAQARPAPYMLTMTHAAAHHSMKVFSRSKGQSAPAAAAYRLGVVMADERTGQTHDYRAKRHGVEYAATVGWDDSDPAGLWNAAEAAEKRKNSAVARESTIAIPAEFSADERARLARGYALWLRDQYGVAATVAVHKPDRRGDERNYHAHVLFTTRTVDDAGEFGAKTRILDDHKTGSAEVERMRNEWATRCNRLLQKKGVRERVDPRSHKRRAEENGGPVLPSVPHLGKDATALSRKRKEIAARTGQSRRGATGLLRVEQEVDAILSQQLLLTSVYRAAKEARWALDYAEAAAATALPEQSAAPASAPEVPTHDPEKRQERMRAALAALRPEDPQSEEWVDEPQDPAQPPRGPQKGRQRSR